MPNSFAKNSFFSSAGLFAESRLFECKQIAFAPSWHCDAYCLHCFLSREARSRDDFRMDILLRILGEVPEVVKRIEITGGEPFLHPKRLLDLVRQITACGKNATVISNGLWMREFEKAKRLLTRLSEAGLNYLAISLDDYHKPSPRLEQVERGLLYAKELDIGVSVKVVGNKSAQILEELIEKGILERSPAMSSWRRLERTGTAKGLPIDSPGFSKGDCCPNISQPLVFPNGAVVACCSMRVLDFDNSVLRLGRINDSTLDFLLERHMRSYLAAGILAFGPAGLLRLAGENEISKESKCLNCVELMNSAEKVERIIDAIDNDREIKKEIAARALLLPDYVASKHLKNWE